MLRAKCRAEGGRVVDASYDMCKSSELSRDIVEGRMRLIEEM